MPKPYAIRFGPWVPDLQDVGVEMPFQWSDTELAVTDCENVYWQDASYRCLPRPAPIGPSLGTPILDCFTWYDNTQQKEVLFALTANGAFTLIDGVWTEIATETNESALGLAITMQLGSPVGLVTRMATNTGGSGPSSSYTYPSPFVASVGYGTPSGYNWRFGGASGPGTWSIASGQGTANATPEVAGSTNGSTNSATCFCDITFAGAVYTVSGPVSYTQEAIAATPTFSPGAGSYGAPQSVTISDSTPGATIHYTTDGSTPTTGSPVYSGAIAVSTTETVKAIAVAAGYVNSAVASATYTIAVSPIIHSYTSFGSGTETVPSGGYTQVVIEVKGGGGGYSSSGTDTYQAGGGGAGYCRSVYAVSTGQTLNYVVGQAGGININNNGTLGHSSSVTSGSLSITSMAANGGGGAIANGAGGAASGGNQVNATGAGGVNGGAGGASGSAGQYFDTGNTYGRGADYNVANETSGFVSFRYS
jgi:hypothetical protein